MGWGHAIFSEANIYRLGFSGCGLTPFGYKNET